MAEPMIKTSTLAEVVARIGAPHPEFVSEAEWTEASEAGAAEAQDCFSDAEAWDRKFQRLKMAVKRRNEILGIVPGIAGSFRRSAR